MSEVQTLIASMRKLIYGNWPMCVTYTFAEIGLADLLTGQPKKITELSVLTKIDKDCLTRFLKCCWGLSFIKMEDELISLTPFGELLSTQHPQSQRNTARLNGAAYRYGPWGKLAEILLHGSPEEFSPSFKNGTIAYLSDKAESMEVFENAMHELSSSEDDSLALAYDFSKFSHVVDIGCGKGSLLQKILERYTQLQGTMFDMKLSAGKNNFDGRLNMFEGDFFESIPIAADLYIMKNVLHNWPVEKLERLLQNLKKTLLSGDNPARKKVLVIEYLVDKNKPGIVDWLDLNFLILVGGKDRSAEEYDLLFQKFGFTRTNIVYTSERSVLEYSL